MNNELAYDIPSQNPSTNEMASQGRGEDSMVAHVTPGDYVIPKNILIQHPEFLVKLKKVMEDEGEDYRTHMIGSGFENMNPGTGAPEFGFGKSFKNIARSAGSLVGQRVGKVLPSSGDRFVGNMVGKEGRFSGPIGSSFVTGFQAGINPPKDSGGGGGSSPYSPKEMALPGSLQELGGLTDQQRRSYLATQGAQGEGIGGNSRDYYVNLLQRNIQANPNQELLPVESQYLTMGGINSNLRGQALIDALRGF